jgi:hypothetical protein
VNDVRIASLIDRHVAAAALGAPRDHEWYSCASADVASVQRALAGSPTNPRRGWFRSCPQSGTPSCNLHGADFGPARASCTYCRGVGHLVSATPSTPGDLVSVLALGAERVQWAEEVLAQRVATDLGMELRSVAWRVVSPRDVRGWPPYHRLAHHWVVPLDAGTDGSVVLGVQWIDEEALRTAARESRSVE